MKYSIGDLVWVVKQEHQEVFEDCPDCCGTGHIKVTMGDGTEYHVECPTCKRGMYPSSGKVSYYKTYPAVVFETITGLRMDGDTPRYTTASRYDYEELYFHADQESALKAAAELAAEQTTGEEAKVIAKHRPSESWAWHATYYQKEIKECQRRIDYATKCLNVANLKKRQDNS